MRILAAFGLVALGVLLVSSRGVEKSPHLVEFDWGDDDGSHQAASPDEEDALECLCVFDSSATSTISFPSPELAQSSESVNDD